MQVLNVNEKQNTQYAIPLWLRDEQIRSALKRPNVGRVQPVTELRNEPCAIVGYGPSLKQTWKKLKGFKWIFSCSGATRFLIDRKIIPSWHVAVDPLPGFTVKLIGEPHPDVEYLISSTCHPDVFDHLSDFNVKLWHVFAQDGESEQVLPRGEWAITGGCDVGLRSLTLARFFGFTDLHVFGVDGSAPDQSARHADAHPNRLQAKCETEYKGRKFYTTPGMLEAARQVFHELDQMPDTKARFYGDGLIQAMAKDYQPKPASNGGLIAFNRPETISQEMRELNARLHRDNLAYGVNGGRHADAVKQMLLGLKTNGLPPSVLDYGSGKGGLQKALGFPIYEYDPAIPGKDESPLPADLVCAFDVLEHVEPDKLKYVLDDLKRCVKQVGYFVIHKGPAKKTYADGRNAHLIQQDVQWWAKKLSGFFTLGKVADRGHEIHAVVGPLATEPKPETTQIGKAVFLTPNKVTKWRAETLLKKEPITIEWIGQMKAGEVLFDIGANVGGYSVWAGIQGVKVFAFEPEAQNYALLTQNLALNGLEASAYPIALTDTETHLGSLYLSDPVAGGSCHSFDSQVGFDLKPRKGITQGCVGMRLDDLDLPHPDHIKIDVDGFEFKVVKGAEKILTKGVKSVLIEVNTNLPEHQEMLRWLGELGYTFDAEQVEKSMRKEGPFKGVAEHVLRRVPSDEQELLKAIENAEVVNEPFPHFVMDFPVHVDIPKEFVPIEQVRHLKGYPSRFVAKEFQRPNWNIKSALLNKFGIKDEGFTDEYLFIQDKPKYEIGPHTDSPARVLSMIAYVGQGKDGTSLYEPKDKDFTCEGGPHYPRKKFKKVKSVPYQKNTAFVFLKTDKSFHGVEPIKSDREVMLYDIRRS